MFALRYSTAFLLISSAAHAFPLRENAAGDSRATVEARDGSTGEPDTSSPAEQPDSAAPRGKRVLVVVSAACAHCAEELAKLESAGGPFEKLRRRGWRIGRGPGDHIQIVDRSEPVDDDIADAVSQLPPGDSPIVLCVEEGAIERSFQRGCTTPLDQWTFGWLMTGNDLRPAAFVPEAIRVQTTGHYRLRGNHWSVEGNWSPSLEDVARHLRAAHSSNLQGDWVIEDWSIEELRSLHDDIHDREEGFRGRYAASTAKPAPTGGSGAGKPGSWRH